jgi:hypothetical protein
VQAYRQRHADRNRLELFVSHEAIERLDALARMQGKSRSAVIEGLLLSTRIVTGNVTGNDSKRTVNVSGNREASKRSDQPMAAAALSSEVIELVKRWRTEGASWAECARQLDAQGIEPPRGGRWLQGRGQTNLARYFRG